jgi:hypothetical protein
MKNNIFKAILVSLVFAFIGLTSCSEKMPDHGLIVSKDNPAQALTVGWYVPVSVLKEIVGPNYEPAVIKDDSIGTIYISIIANGDHRVDSLDCGSIKAAHLFVAVNKPSGLKFASASTITNYVVSPASIVDQSPVLGNKYHDFGFPTYTGKINLDVKWSGEKYHAVGTIETSNGKIEIVAVFDEKPFENEMVSAVFNPKSSTYDFMFGKEFSQQIINGKGTLKTEGNNLVTAMNLSGQPYYLKLGLGVNWIFDFEKE